MKKIFSIILIGCLTMFCATSCMDDFDEPNAGNSFTAKVGEVNSTIKAVKDKYCASSDGADFTRNKSNFFSKVKEDLIIDGVIVANDVSGNLYQTLMIRTINGEEDNSLIVAIKNTCLYPYFKLGQRIKINVKDLYAGCYSKVPRIGMPYKTSKGNLNLGPIFFEVALKHIEIVGTADKNAPELVPVVPTEEWLKSRSNQNYLNCPMLATVKGKIQEVQGSAAENKAKGELTGDYEPLPKIFGPDALHDAGFGIDREMRTAANNKVTIRTSANNPVGFMLIPQSECTFTGVMSYYDGWQLQMRDTDDCPEAKAYTEAYYQNPQK